MMSSFYEVKPVPNESPVTLLATHAKNGEFITKNFRKSIQMSKNVIFHSNEMEHNSTLCSKIEICPA